MNTESIRNETEKRVLEIISESLDDGRNQNVTLESTLEQLNVASIDFIKIIVGLEEEYDIEFDDEMLLFESFMDVTSIVDYVLKKLEETAV